MLHHPGDRVQTVAIEEFLAGNSALILVEIILHDVMRGHGQAVGLAAFERSEHSLFRGHGIGFSPALTFFRERARSNGAQYSTMQEARQTAV